MITHKDHFHGSDLEKIEEVFHIDKNEIIRFSSNVNPLGISPLLRQGLVEQIDAISTYPDREYTSLRNCIAAYSNTLADNIIVGNGSTELISLFIQIEHPKKALVLGPTYSEYEREVTLGGGTTHYYPLREEQDFQLDIQHFTSKLNDSIDLLILCNPNNPTSTSITQEQMRRILDVCKEYDIFVMVDETYVEFSEQLEQITSVPLTRYYNNIIILRGTSKFFAAPGLRLGYAISGNQDLIQAMQQRKNPWTINSLAVVAGTLMFQDETYIQQTKSLISKEKQRIYHGLKESKNLYPYKPDANFMLLKIKDSSVTSGDLFAHAIKNKMMIRDCSTFPFLNDKFIRFCFMNPSENDALVHLLLEYDY